MVKITRREKLVREKISTNKVISHSLTFQILLRHGCDATAMDTQGWTVTQEAVGSGNAGLLSQVDWIFSFISYVHLLLSDDGSSTYAIGRRAKNSDLLCTYLLNYPL